MDKIEEFLQKAEKHCQQRGGRLTQKRKQVLYVLLKAEKAIAAYELIKLYQVYFKQTLPPMTTYRILEYLERIHLAHKISIANKYVACSRIGCDQEHLMSQFLLCKQCQRVSEVAVDNVSYNALKQHIKQVGHQLLSQQIELNCICNACIQN